MPNSIDKASIINKFITDVINPAVGAIQTDTTSLESVVGFLPNVEGRVVGEVIDKNNFKVKPKDFFTEVQTIGHAVSPEVLVQLFQHYAFLLTAVRSAAIKPISAGRGVVPKGHTLVSIPDTIVRRGITALNSNFRMPIVQFKLKVGDISYLNQEKPISLDNIDKFIAKLASILETRRTEDQNLNAYLACHNSFACHSNCHGSCHGSRSWR